MPIETAQPITFAQLLELWKSATDQGYHQPFLEQENSGVEAHEQAWIQFERASEMVNRSTQAMFILPWSGQSDEPASGGRNARVTLTFTRTRLFEEEISIAVGTIVQHVTVDYGKEGGVEVVTGRRYRLLERVLFLPGHEGPIEVEAEAERPGYGYNLPLPGTIQRIEQLGPGFTNDNAEIIPPATIRQARSFGDVITSAQIGQYVEILTGPNEGQKRRILDFRPPTTEDDGGDVVLDQVWTFTGSTVGTLIPGETVRQAATSVEGRLFGVVGDRVLIESPTGDFVVGQPIEGEQSTAVFTPVVIEQSGTLTADPNALWRVLPWGDDQGSENLGIEVTNEESPSGGRSPMLDELGSERGVFRADNESDDSYRLRVATPADVVSPNAIVRTLNRALAPFGLSACFREVGTDLFPGFFFDAGSSEDTPQDPDRNFAWDMDGELRPEDRFKTWLSFAEFRAFFLVGVPRLGLGEFGFPYDATSDGVNAYGSDPQLQNAYDGYPIGNATIYSVIFNAIERARAGGVGFDLYVEDVGCF